MPKHLQNGAKIHEKSMPERRRETHGKNNIWENEAKIDEKSMKNRRRNGRRYRDEKRALEVQISCEISNPRILKKYENIQVL